MFLAEGLEQQELPNEDFTPVKERPTMQQEGLFEPGWLEEEFEQARRDVAMWPEWKRRLVGLDHTPGPVDMKHAPPDRGRTNDEPTASNNE